MKKFNLNIPRAGYFIVYKNSGGFVKNQIEKQQLGEGYDPEDSKYVHVECSLGGQYAIRASLPYIRPIDITKDHKGKYIKIVKPSIEDYNGNKVAIWCATRCNLPYGVFSIIWHKMKGILKKNIFACFGDICSELSAYGIYREHVKGMNDKLGKKYYSCLSFLPKEYQKMMPVDFLNEEYFTVVWEGYIK